MVAVETSIDVGNILWIFYDCISSLLACLFRVVIDRHIQTQTHNAKTITPVTSEIQGVNINHALFHFMQNY